MFLSKEVEGLDITSDEIAYQHMIFTKFEKFFQFALLVDIPSEIGFFNHFTTRAAIINTIVLNSSTTLVLPL